MSQQTKPVEVFISYSHRDEKLRERLDSHLSLLRRQEVIQAWHDRKITAGSEWAGAIDDKLNSADIILLLISDQFLASDYCYGIEMQRAMERHEAKEACVIPIILKPVDWSSAPFAKLQAFPKDAKPVTKWNNRDEAFLNIAKGIREAAETIAARPQKPSPEPEPVPSPDLSEAITVIPPDRLDLPEGSVGLNSPLYVERPPIEANCYGEIVKPGALIRIKAPRQWGKTSLMQRILQRSREHGHRTVCLNLQLVDGDSLTSIDRLLQWLCASVANELNLDDRLSDVWKPMLGSKSNCTNYFQRYLLPTIQQPLTLGLDEVDQVFQHLDVAQDFFGLLRAWHEMSKNDPTWQRLGLVIAHSREVYIPLNVEHSPFNVGLPTELPEFTSQQVIHLVQRHGLRWSEPQIAQLLEMVSGHPYLVRKALYEMARGMTLERFLQTAPTEAGLYGDHLRRHLENLHSDPQLATAMKQVVSTPGAVGLEPKLGFRLHSMGLVRLQDDEVIALCHLYRLYFAKRLGGRA
ncbi:AAA-like domain-containing protein [Oscillatoria sp. FACHB-1407]|uniref:AAA-like domain-containing protein n=1 Tax=Oscillatoria sp. FACHB-1407 TaxID=2692847 RepID=UPI00168326C0|nr:AAA-like domain-containing protein [Oscillatoria sp. FACHB-1407]MBD2461867.1 AAA-like domain-containing protein [Oscillatoria sp. FACHB-1407]